MARGSVSVVSIGGDSGLSYGNNHGPSLPPGVYRMISTMREGPGFAPIVADNDPPLEVDPIISGVVDEMATFLARAADFARFGFAHKRGYLFHGPPGCGKSAALRLVEQKFIERFEGLALIWSPGGGAPTEWVDLIRENEPDRPLMLVCEDIDHGLPSFECEVLEFLDGQTALKKLILVATTNHLEAIPDRIRKRPSRIDRVISVPLPPTHVRVEYLRRLGLDSDRAVFLAASTEGFSMAALKEVVIGTECLGQPLEDILIRLRELDGEDLSADPLSR